MTMCVRVLNALPLVGVMLLSSCGGSQVGAPSNQQAGIAVGEPNPNAAPALARFIEQARQSSCADTSNRLYVIDQQTVFWERSGNCADNAYAYALYGATPDVLLCSSSDSIAGPMTSCVDDKSRALFDTIVKNLDQAELGLAGQHKVAAVPFLAQDGSSLAFATVAADNFSGVVQARNVVIKDEVALRALWAEHTAGQANPAALPKLDFTKHMLLALFAGPSSVCNRFGVRAMTVDGERVRVDYENLAIRPEVMCIALAASPMQLLRIAHTDAEVVFTQIDPERVAFSDIEHSTRSGVSHAQQQVIRDAQSWSVLWEQHAGPGAIAPRIDFDQEMVVAVFLGTRPNGCYSTDISELYRHGGKLHLIRTDWEPAESGAMMCSQALTSPAHMVRLARSDETLVFSSQIQYLE